MNGNKNVLLYIRFFLLLLSFSNFIFIITVAHCCVPCMRMFLWWRMDLGKKKKKIFSKNKSGFDGNFFIKISKIMESWASIQSDVRLHLFDFIFSTFHLFTVFLCNRLCVQWFLYSWFICSHYLLNTFHQNAIEKELIGKIFSFHLLCFALSSNFLAPHFETPYSRTSSRFSRICQFDWSISWERISFLSSIPLPLSLFVHFGNKIAVKTELVFSPNNQIIKIWINIHIWNVKRQFFTHRLLSSLWSKKVRNGSLLLAIGYSYSHASIIFYYFFFFLRHHLEFGTHSDLLTEKFGDQYWYRVAFRLWTIETLRGDETT